MRQHYCKHATQKKASEDRKSVRGINIFIGEKMLMQTSSSEVCEETKSTNYTLSQHRPPTRNTTIATNLREQALATAHELSKRGAAVDQSQKCHWVERRGRGQHRPIPHTTIIPLCSITACCCISRRRRRRRRRIAFQAINELVLGRKPHQTPTPSTAAAW